MDLFCRQHNNYNLYIIYYTTLMTSQKNLIAVHFSAYALTSIGETVCITGNCPELGMWDPKKGFKLQTNPKQYPIWFSKNPIILQKLTTIEYKLCIMGPDDNILRWQSLKQNRTLALKTSCSIFLTEDDGEVEYDQENEDTVSTKINSTYQGYLSQIEEESQQEEPHAMPVLHQESSMQKKKRSSSSKRANSLPENEQNIIFSCHFPRQESSRVN